MVLVELIMSRRGCCRSEFVLSVWRCSFVMVVAFGGHRGRMCVGDCACVCFMADSGR